MAELKKNDFQEKEKIQKEILSKFLDLIIQNNQNFFILQEELNFLEILIQNINSVNINSASLVI